MQVRITTLDFIAITVLTATLCGCRAPAQEPRAGLSRMEWQSASSMSQAEMELVAALEKPLLDAMDVEKALACWFRGRAAAAENRPEAAEAAWQEGLTFLDAITPLPKAEWGPNPAGNLKKLEKLQHPGTEGTACHIVTWVVDDLRQYGVLLRPDPVPAVKMPVLLYLHGAAYGVPLHALPWLADMAKEGYVVIGPALRGEPLFSSGRFSHDSSQYRSEGNIENLDGEVNDALAAVDGAQKLPYAAPGKFAIIGHSFGAGVGLLVSARSEKVACTISYDAWLTNPFRYYWDRMRRGANNWLSWAEYCNQPVPDQLRGLMRRSITHHAESIDSPLLLFIGGAYDGSVFHLSHQDFIARLQEHDKDFIYDVVPGGGHNFVLYYNSEPARYAYAKHMEFLRRNLPPAGSKASQKAPVIPPMLDE